MVSDQTTICNVAISRCGSNEFIDSVADPDSASAAALRVHWDRTVELLLGEGLWSFASNRVTLAETDGDPFTPWSYQYAAPSDMVRVVRIEDGRMVPREDDKISFQIDGVPGVGRVIHCNQPSAVLLYVWRNLEVGLWSEGFSDYLASSLANEICDAISASEISKRKIIAYWLPVSKARAVASEGNTFCLPEVVNDFVAARRGRASDDVVGPNPVGL